MQYYALHSEEITARARAKYHADLEKSRARGRAYTVKYPGRSAAAARVRYYADLEKSRARRLKWHYAHPENVRRNHARAALGGKDVPQELVESLVLFRAIKRKLKEMQK
jgi:hypothetical protein